MSSKKLNPAACTAEHAARISSGAIVKVSSLRSNFASRRAGSFHSKIALRAGCEGSPATTAAVPDNVKDLVILKIRLVKDPLYQRSALSWLQFRMPLRT